MKSNRPIYTIIIPLTLCLSLFKPSGFLQAYTVCVLLLKLAACAVPSQVNECTAMWPGAVEVQAAQLTSCSGNRVWGLVPTVKLLLEDRKILHSFSTNSWREEKKKQEYCVLWAKSLGNFSITGYFISQIDYRNIFIFTGLTCGSSWLGGDRGLNTFKIWELCLAHEPWWKTLLQTFY